jgi:hypothetical protein
LRQHFFLDFLPVIKCSSRPLGLLLFRSREQDLCSFSSKYIAASILPRVLSFIILLGRIKVPQRLDFSADRSDSHDRQQHGWGNIYATTEAGGTPPPVLVVDGKGTNSLTSQAAHHIANHGYFGWHDHIALQHRPKWLE